MLLKNLSKKELELIDKVSKKEKIKFNDYFDTIKLFSRKYKCGDEFDEETNKIIYQIHQIHQLYKNNNDFKGTKFFKEYITFSTK